MVGFDGSLPKDFFLQALAVGQATTRITHIRMPTAFVGSGMTDLRSEAERTRIAHLQLKLCGLSRRLASRNSIVRDLETLRVWSRNCSGLNHQCDHRGAWQRDSEWVHIPVNLLGRVCVVTKPAEACHVEQLNDLSSDLLDRIDQIVPLAS